MISKTFNLYKNTMTSMRYQVWKNADQATYVLTILNIENKVKNHLTDLVQAATESSPHNLEYN